MAVINVLSPHVADMIAAGEVVERPASVVKELMENSFDALAKNVTVEIRGGGATYIRVTDDGVGMAGEDAGVAFLRHATSKLHDERGLEAISTMGFRGEALAAISAVSRIELKTRLRGTDEGTLVTLDGGDIQDMTPCGCPEGTSMIVRDLFYNTPARLKFLKSDRSEAAACTLAALRCALGRPEVSVRFIRDGSEEFFSPGDGRLDSCAYSLLGRELASTLLEIASEDDGVRVRGFVSSPSAGRGSRGAQYFFCNGRFIRSALLQAAVEQAYKNTLLTGRYPACVVYLELGCGSVDVNVHPAKTEVKFSYEKKVFDLVYHAALFALTGESRVGAGTSSQTAPDAAKDASRTEAPRESAQAAYARHGWTPPRQSAAPGAKAGLSAARGIFPAQRAYTPSASAGGDMSAFMTRDVPYQTRLDLTSPRVSTENDKKGADTTASAPILTQPPVENPVQNVESSSVPDHKIVGEALRTYIIVETGDELIWIDKHAAHERMIFDRLKAAPGEIMSQRLLAPVTLRLDGESMELIERNSALLSALGFELDAFGEREYILRALPADMLPGDAVAAVEEICEKLRRGKSLSAEDARDEILHTVACKAAIKAGWDTDAKELERIAAAVLSGQVKYCPHGRPVSITMTRRDLDKQFKRIV